MFRAALYMVISDFKVFIVFVALGLPFPQVHLSVGGGGGGGQLASYPVSLVESLVPAACACARILQKTV